MYYEHYGLVEPPFRITPDTRLFYEGGSRGPILDAMVYAIGNGEGIIKVVGEVGSGKTMLCRMLEVRLADNVEVVYLANPSLSPENILHAIAFELNLPVAEGASRLQVMQALQSYLLERHGAGRQVVVFVEEAQSMPLETLEEIRLLSNLETQRHKLLQLVLFGQPELEPNLSAPHIRQLRERITHSFELPPFSRKEIKEYLEFRMAAAGYRGVEVFSDGAVARITRASGGLIRRVNIIADKSLLAAYAQGRHRVTPREVRTAVRDSDFSSTSPRRKGALALWLVFAASAGAAFTAAAVLLWPSLPGIATGGTGPGGSEPMQTEVPAAPPAPEPPAAPTPQPPAPEAPPAVEGPVALAPEAVSPAPADAPVPMQPGPDPEAGEGAPPPPALEGLTARMDTPPPESRAPSRERPAPPPAEPLGEDEPSNARADPVPVAPEPRAVPGGESYYRARLAATRQWLREADPEHFSIQLMLISPGRGKNLAGSLRQAGLGDRLDQVWVYHTRIRGDELVSVLLGDFARLDEAREVLEGLAPSMKVSQPFIRNVGDVRAGRILAPET